MGIDVYYNAMVEDCKFFRLAKADFKYSDFLTDLTTSYEAIYAPWIYSDKEPTSMDLKITEARKELRKTNIGIENRSHVTRAWDIFLWLLTEQRRVAEVVDLANFTDIWGRAILGGDYVYKAGYQEPRFLRPTEVQIITEKLISVSDNDLGKFYTQEITGVYKYRYNIENPDQGFAFILEQFNELRNFYKSVAENNEGVITTRW